MSNTYYLIPHLQAIENELKILVTEQFYQIIKKEKNKNFNLSQEFNKDIINFLAEYNITNVFLQTHLESKKEMELNHLLELTLILQIFIYKKENNYITTFEFKILKSFLIKGKGKSIFIYIKVNLLIPRQRIRG